MGNTVNLIGFNEFSRKMKELPQVLQEEVSAEIEFAAKDWEGRASLAAPKDTSRLNREIKGFLIRPLTAEVVVNVEYAPFVEWGTKTKVRVPGDIAGYAAQFRGAKLGAGNAKRMIYAWMRRVGIAEEFWWPVFYSIITKGIKPHPFFFIQKPTIERELVANIKNILKTPH